MRLENRMSTHGEPRCREDSCRISSRLPGLAAGVTLPPACTAVEAVRTPKPVPPDNPDIYFLFAGFHLLFSAYMAVGIPCTSPPGLIRATSRIHG